MPDEYILTPQELTVVQRYLVQIRPLQSLMYASLDMIIAQQEFPGRWELNAEGTKLIRKDLPCS